MSEPLAPLGPHGVRAILLDVEGTTTSIAFVASTLFPFARARLPAFVAAHRDALADLDPDPLARLIEWMDEDAKQTRLKDVQGRIWRDGYRAGELRGHVYPDTPDALRRWHDAGVAVHIYSSGSVEAQQLLFRHSIAGDLTPLITGHFDTRIGAKQAPASYRAIADALGLAAGDMLFVSDVTAENDAARAAGMAALLIDRAGGAGDVASLADILP